MQVSPYLNFPGNCSEAFDFYAKVLGSKIENLLTHADSPMKDQHADWGDKVLHVTMKVDDAILSGSDAPPEYYHKPEGFYVTLGIEKPADADRIYNALIDGGSVHMPIQETFWAKRFAMLTDRYGIPWMINC